LTPIGHTLTGLAIGYLAIPRDAPRKQRAVLLGAFALAASAPDLPFPYWGHSDYRISHSLLSTAIGVTILNSILWIRFRGRKPVTLGVMFGLALAWYSHILLDSFYNHAWGLPVLWPFSDARLALPIPWLSIGNKNDIFSMHNVKVAVFEILTFGPLLLLAYLVKKCFVPVGRTNALENTNSV
jgi:membrane-bound metal-dependent hydrolase YbcI (DUF457 family)